MEIAFHGLQLHCPFSSHFRRHTPTELSVMEATIREYGIREPIRIYTDTTLNKENCVGDGEGRLTLAVKLGLAFEAVRFEDFGEMTTQEAYEGIALVHNDGRRQDTEDAVEKRRREVEEKHNREHEVIRLRDVEKKTFREIGEKLKISHTQAQNDYKDAHAVGKGLPTGQAETVTGRDGKEYPASKPKPESPPVDSTPKFIPQPPLPPPPPPTPIPKPVVKAQQKAPFDWGPLENTLGNLRDLLDDAMEKLRLADSTEHKEAVALLDDFEVLLLSGQQKDLSVKWRLQHAG